MATTLEIFAKVAPEYAEHPDAAFWLEQAVLCNAPPDAWGACYPLAMANWAAFNLDQHANEGADGAAGPLASETAGSESRSYAAAQGVRTGPLPAVNKWARAYNQFALRTSLSGTLLP